MELVIGDWNGDQGFGIRDWRLELDIGIGDLDWGPGLGIWIGDWDLG